MAIGGGLPLPATKEPPPHGRIYPVRGAHVTQPTTGADPRPMVVQPGQLTNPPVPEVAKGQFPNNSALFEVQSNLSFSWPASQNGAITLSAGGRTGANTTTYVPGGEFYGSIKYTRTSNQFGGPGEMRVGGTAKVWAVAVSPPPCVPSATCIAAKMVANPASLGVIGAQFGNTNYTSPVNQKPGIYVVGAVSSGTIFFRTPTPNSNYGPTNAASSIGAPWTTGMITVSQPKALGGTEVWALTGSDNRVNGLGNISLVAGSLSNRALSGPNANRGWLNLKVVARTPSLSSWGIASLALVLAGGGAAARLSLARRKR